MIQKIFNLIAALTFFTLVLLFAYKMTSSPEKVVAAMPGSELSNNQKIFGNGEEFKQEVYSIIKDYIANNPEIIVQSLEGLHNKNVAESTKKTFSYLEENKGHIEEIDSPPVIGNLNADISIVTFFDYNCSFCKKAHIYETEILSQDPGVKIILRPIPILGDNSLYAAKVALAVQKIAADNFVNVHNELMAMTDISVEKVKLMLAKYNIDYSLVENEVNSYALKQVIAKNFEMAKEIGIKGTPSYVINNNFIAGLITTDKFKSLILELRATEKNQVENSKEVK